MASNILGRAPPLPWTPRLPAVCVLALLHYPGGSAKLGEEVEIISVALATNAQIGDVLAVSGAR